MATIFLKSIAPWTVKLIFKDGIIREVSPGQVIEVGEENRGLHDGKQGPMVEIEIIKPTIEKSKDLIAEIIQELESNPLNNNEISDEDSLDEQLTDEMAELISNVTEEIEEEN